MSNMLLGVCDGEIPRGEESSWLTNKVGGAAVWPEDVKAPDTACYLCGGASTLVVQIYCPLEGSPYHRALYVFACTKKPCCNRQQSWQVYRVMQLVPDYNKPAVTSPEDLFDVGWGDDDWGGGSSMEADAASSLTELQTEPPNGSQSNSTSSGSLSELEASETNSQTAPSINPENMDMDMLSIDDGGPHQQCQAEDLPIQAITNSCLKDLVNIPGVAPDGDASNSARLEHSAAEDIILFKPWYLSVVEEPCEDSHDLRHENKLLCEYSKRTGTDFSGPESKKSAKGEAYEKGVAAHGDRIFQKFLKRISRYPSQVIRYSYSGEVLPMVALPSTPPSACSSCGSSVVFELQILPSLISFLTTPQSQECALEFGTVLVYSCGANCWSDDVKKPRSEQIILQADPDQKLYK